MAPDPYRVLGVERTTPVAEIKRAYRRLAKANHPDSAGPDALARFLEIQAAYEEIVEGKPRPRGPGNAPPGPPAPGWRADPERARATRETWRRRSSRPSGAGAPGSARPGTRSGATPGPDPGPDGGTPGGRSRRGGRRGATLGSTTYDGADAEAFDPAWGGASWYGPSSGTYWTLNPKEYADPRKHGPEYQARARRSAGGSGSSADPLPDDTSTAPDEAGPNPADEAEPAAPQRTAPAADTRSPASRLASHDGSPIARPASDPDRPAPGDRPPASGGTSGITSGVLDQLRSPGRVLTALIAWPPIGLTLALVIGELTGCARFAVSCADTSTAWAWLLQAATLVAFLVLPSAARIAAAGTYGVLIVATPLTIFLTSGGRDTANVSTPVLFGGLGAAWVAGVVMALARRSGRSDITPPVP